jgi:protein disulfide-isomerase
VKKTWLLCAIAALQLAGCHRSPSPAEAASAEGIAWFPGTIDEAFAVAAKQQKLVFLYWGAEWCPPCHDLKAHVFSRRDFQEKLRQFVPVYLDGDAVGAQRAGEQFHVLGYPTALVLDADRQEIARIAGGGDLGSYADVLDLSLENVRPLSSVMTALQADHLLALSAADCRRLAWNGWGLDPREDPEALSATLELAAARCPDAAVGERDRLMLTATDLAASHERAAIEGGKPVSARLGALLDAVSAMLADHARALQSGDALHSMGDDYFVVARLARPEQVAALQANWFAVMDAMESDARYGDGTRLASVAASLQAAKLLDKDGRIPDELAAKARATLDTYLARDYDMDTRAGVINAAEWVLTYLDDKARLRTLLEGEISTSKTPFYYMADLADLEEEEGNSAQALDLLERAYRESTGPATRFQWGTLYAEGLLRMSPDDKDRIRASTLDVLGELAGPDRIHARTRVRLEGLDKALGKWAGATRNAATLRQVAEQWQKICTGLPAGDPVRGECSALVGAGS